MISMEHAILLQLDIPLMLDIVFQIPTDTLNSPYSSDKVHQCYIDTKGNVDYNIWVGGDYYENIPFLTK